MDEPTELSCIYIWSASDGQVHRVTDAMHDSHSPAWDTEGNYLYYVGVREFYPLVSDIEPNFSTTRGKSMLAVALRKDVKNPFPAESDEVTVGPLGEGEKKTDEKAEVKKAS